MESKIRLTDERMFDSICTNNEKLEELLLEIGRRLKRERIKKGYTVNELSQLIGIATPVLYRLEKEATPVGFRSFLKMMWCLNVPPGQLIPFDEYAHEKTFGDVIDELTCNLTPKQRQYLIRVIKTVISLLNLN